MGKEGKYDLKLVEQPLASDSDSETESEDGGLEIGGETFITALPGRTDQPAKIIKGIKLFLLNFFVNFIMKSMSIKPS